MSSRLFIEIREKLGLVYSIKCGMTNYDEIGYFNIHTQNENKETMKCIEEIFKQLTKLITYGVSDTELTNNKTNYCDIYKTNFDDIEYENEFYCNQILFNKPLETLQNKIDIATQEDGKIPMAVVEASSTARKEYNDCVNRQQKLLQDLKVKRSERLSKQVKENASILNLVEMWKQEESRQKLLKIAELRKNSIKKEIERLGTMDELKARILGISEDDILNG